VGTLRNSTGHEVSKSPQHGGRLSLSIAANGTNLQRIKFQGNGERKRRDKLFDAGTIGRKRGSEVKTRQRSRQKISKWFYDPSILNSRKNLTTFIFGATAQTEVQSIDRSIDSSNQCSIHVVNGVRIWIP
jgi:hypothetical protein